MNPVTQLELLPLAFAEHFNNRDIDALLALNEHGSVFVPQPGVPVQDEAGIRAALEQFLALNLPITMGVKRHYSAGEIGLVSAEWTISGVGPDGSEIALAGTTSDVARYSDGAGWRYVIDNPFGVA